VAQPASGSAAKQYAHLFQKTNGQVRYDIVRRAHTASRRGMPLEMNVSAYQSVHFVISKKLSSPRVGCSPDSFHATPGYGFDYQHSHHVKDCPFPLIPGSSYLFSQLHTLQYITAIQSPFSMDKKLQWTSGGDNSLECRRRIGHGGSGDVYEVFLLKTKC